MSQDVWAEMDSYQRRVAEERAATDEHARRTMVDLLLARGEGRAAAIVAMSSYATVLVDNWDGGQYQVLLSVPAAFFDRVGGPLKAALAAAAEAIVGTSQFAGLDLSVKWSVASPEWDAELMTELAHRWRQSGEASVPVLPPGNRNAST